MAYPLPVPIPPRHEVRLPLDVVKLVQGIIKSNGTDGPNTLGILITPDSIKLYGLYASYSIPIKHSANVVRRPLEFISQSDFLTATETEGEHIRRFRKSRPMLALRLWQYLGIPDNWAGATGMRDRIMESGDFNRWLERFEKNELAWYIFRAQNEGNVPPDQWEKEARRLKRQDAAPKAAYTFPVSDVPERYVRGFAAIKDTDAAAPLCHLRPDELSRWLRPWLRLSATTKNRAALLTQRYTLKDGTLSLCVVGDEGDMDVTYTASPFCNADAQGAFQMRVTTTVFWQSVLEHVTQFPHLPVTIAASAAMFRVTQGKWTFYHMQAQQKGQSSNDHSNE